MTELSLPSGSNPAINKRSPRLINCYAEAVGQGGKSPFSLVPSAGTKTFSANVTGVCRGLEYLEDDELIAAVRGSNLTTLDSAGTATKLGFIPGADPVSMARNDAEPQQLVIVAGDRVYKAESGLLSKIDYPDLTPAGVTFCSGYFVYWEGNGRFHVSDLSSTNVDPLSFATAEGNPDGLTAAHGSVTTLYLIGPVTTEIWSLSGGDFPFARQGGAHLLIGSKSPHTVRTFNNGMVMVGSDNVVYQVLGYAYDDISSKEVSRLIEAETDKSAIVGFTHTRGDNKFYTLQGTGWTREYNAATKEWHDREDVRGNPWRARFHVEAWGRDIFGDSKSGQLIEGDYSLNTDLGDELPWGFDTAIFHGFPNGASFERVDLDMETGYGLSLTEDSYVMLCWSDDEGRTWKGYRRLKLGKLGEYTQRVRTRRLGQSGGKGRIFRVRITDDTVRGITGIDAQVSKVDL